MVGEMNVEVKYESQTHMFTLIIVEPRPSLFGHDCHIHNYIFDVCTHRNIITDCQFGFHPGFSTESALSVTNSWFSFLDSYKSVCAVFFDLRKAFDSVPHRPLLDSLASLDIPPLLLRWFHDYLCNRSQIVVVNGSSSLSSNVLSGVPQGSILGPLLFIITIPLLMQI